MRRCLNPACAMEPPSHMRADAKYCSDACSKRVRRAAREGLTDPGAPQRFWTGMSRVRRPAPRPHRSRSRGAA